MVKYSTPLVTLELRGLTRGQLRYDISKPGGKLYVSCPFAIAAIPHVRAAAIIPGVFYQMDADLTPGKDFIWPVDEVLGPNRLSADKIALYGWYAEKDRQVYFPVIVNPIRGGMAADWRDRMVVQTQAVVLKMICRWVAENGRRDSLIVPIPSASTKAQSVEIVLPAGLWGVNRIVVKAMVQSGGTTRWIDREFYIDMGRR